MPAVTVNDYGKGKCILYACDGNDVLFYEALARAVNSHCEISPLVPSSDDGILFASRKTDSESYLFAVNMKESEQSFALFGGGTELISGKEVSDRVTLRGYETAVIRIVR